MLRERGGAAAPPGDGGPFVQILENMRAMLCELDSKGVLTYLSPTVSEILGYSVDEVLGRPGLEWIHADDMRAVSRLFTVSIAQEQGARFVYRAQHKAGHWVWLEGTSSVYRGADGSLRIVALSRAPPVHVDRGLHPQNPTTPHPRRTLESRRRMKSVGII